MPPTSTHPIDFALLGVFTNIQWKEPLNGFLEKHPGEIYCFPWGDRASQLRQALQYLGSQGLWTSTDQSVIQSGKTIRYKVWYPVQKDGKTLWFFHHESKRQGDKGQILFQYDIRYVVLAPEPISPVGNVSHPLIEESSETRLGIGAYRSAFRSGKPLNFSADFDRVDLKTGTKKQMHEARDSNLLYGNMAIVQHFSHKACSDCSCPQCR